MHISVGKSSEDSPERAAAEAVRTALERTGNHPPVFAFTFATAHYDVVALASALKRELGATTPIRIIFLPSLHAGRGRGWVPTR